MAVLMGYSPTTIICGVCLDSHMAIETTNSPELVLLRCWCGATSKGPRSDPRIVALIGDGNTPPEPSDGMVDCPGEGCKVRLAEDDMRAQMAHMEQFHPDIVAERQRAVARG